MLTKLLTTPTEKLGKCSRFVIFQLKLWRQCARLLKHNRAGQQAAALSYHTIFGIIPLAIVMLLIFQSMPAYEHLGEKVRTFIYDQAYLSTIEFSDPASPDQDIKLTDHIDNISSRFFTVLNKGSVTIFSSIIVIWAAIALLTTIERAFNNIYHVPKGRSFIHRLVNYWTLLTLGPLLLALGLYATARMAAIGWVQTSIIYDIAPAVVSYIVSVAAFFFLYFLLPNTRVSPKSALWGAMVAVLVWGAVKALFSFYVAQYEPYRSVYGALGLVPLGVLWIYITWLTVLFGLQLTFTTQHLKTLEAAELAATKKSEQYFIADDFSAINVMIYIAKAFKERTAPVSAEAVCSALDLPPEFGERILSCLVAENLLVKTTEPKSGFAPATGLENIKLSDISSVVTKAGVAHTLPQNAEQIRVAQNQTLSQYSLEQIIKDRSPKK